MNMKKHAPSFPGFTHGMGIGGWLTNYKRFNVLPQDWRLPLSPGDYEHFETYITEADVANIASMGMDHIRVGFGTIRHAPKESRENYMRDLISVLKEYGMPFCVWNYLSTPNDGNRFSLVDDDTRKILSPEMGRIIRGEV